MNFYIDEIIISGGNYIYRYLYIFINTSGGQLANYIKSKMTIGNKIALKNEYPNDVQIYMIKLRKIDRL
jgi:hypothetical protein